MPDIAYADIEWDENGTPVSAHFDDPYYSRVDGPAETRHVFLAGNGLPQRWQNEADFTIAELGFGTGLNFLETLIHWQAHMQAHMQVHRQARRQAQSGKGHLTYVAFEKFPMPQADLARALGQWQGLCEHAAPLIAHWPPQTGWSRQIFGSVTLELAIGDANDMLQTWSGSGDAWYLDGFSPAKNPDLWGEALMREVAERTAPGGTFATFTAAGWVRRNLQAAGFSVEKMPGFGRKRECLRGQILPLATAS